MTSNLILIGGGARSGKSAYALRRAMQLGKRRFFVATAQAFDEEMRVRIAAHRAERSHDFSTIEASLELETALEKLGTSAADVVVIDCLTLWLSNLLLADSSPETIERRVARLVHVVAASPCPVLLVTNEVGFGLVPETPLGRVFRDVAGRAHQSLARAAGEVYLAVLGCILRIKPSPLVAAE